MAEKVTGKEPNGSPVARLWEFLRSNNKVTVGFVVVAAFFIIAMIAPLLANHEPNQQDLANTYRPPFWGRGGNLNNIFGTDSLGRDIYSRVVYGTRASAYVAVVGASFAGLLGITIGILAGYLKGAVEQITMRIVDMWMSFPPVLFSIALITILGVGINNVVLAIIVIDWTRFARVIRSETLGISERDHVQIAKTLGFKSSTVIREEIIPNVLPIIVVLFTLEMSIAITVEVLLSFAGVGVNPIMPSWGTMIGDGLNYFRQDIWGIAFPMLALIVVIIGINLLGDGLREKLDPRLQLVRELSAK
ncbi:MAG: ABC transporter permease [Thaumarchaeota archaeon]|nr:MAG: ABC transporter permease [Nitrososphaerota archaeon]